MLFRRQVLGGGIEPLFFGSASEILDLFIKNKNLIVSYSKQVNKNRENFFLFGRNPIAFEYGHEIGAQIPKLIADTTIVSIVIEIFVVLSKKKMSIMII